MPEMAPPPESPPVAHATPPQVEDETVLAVVSYVLTWITGLIIYYLSKKDQRYARWNAVQAIGLGIAAAVVGIALNLLGAASALVGGLGAPLFSALGGLVALATIVLIVVCAVKAYHGRPLRIPVIAGFADKYA